jgi:hypothetical protein
MKADIDYWMLGVIEEAIQQKKRKLPEGHHLGCSEKCLNKWCETGKCNLILERIDKERSNFSSKVEEYLEEE